MFKAPLIETDPLKVQQYIKDGATLMYDVAKSAFGPGSSNVILGFRHGPPLFSHDGVTNLRMVRAENPFVDDVIQAIHTASQQNNQKVGDGTTAVVILIYHLLLAALKMNGLGVSQREIVAKLNQARETALEYIDSIKKPVNLSAKDSESYLEKIASISANDLEIGAMIADIMHEIGVDGGVIIESYEGLGVHSEIVNGFYFDKGFKSTALINDPTNNQSLHENIPIFISNKKFSTNVDIAPVIDAITNQKIKEFILIADMTDEVGQTLLELKGKGFIFCAAVEPPFVSGSRNLFLEDIALLTGAKVFDGIEFDDDNPVEDYLGFAKEVLITAGSTTVIGGDGDTKAIDTATEILRAQTNEATHPQSIIFAKERLARLAGKMAKIKAGGALELERDELKLRIQDAVSAVQSAIKDGVIPGGGTTLARVNGTDFDDAFKQPFRILMENTGFNSSDYLTLLKNSPDWYGFDLTNITDKPHNMLKLGVLDASLVQKEVVRNAITCVIGLIRGGAQISQSEKD